MAMRTIGLAAVNDIGDVSHVERSHPSVFPALGEDFQNLPEKWKKQLLDGVETLFRTDQRLDSPIPRGRSRPSSTSRSAGSRWSSSG